MKKIMAYLASLGLSLSLGLVPIAAQAASITIPNQTLPDGVQGQAYAAQVYYQYAGGDAVSGGYQIYDFKQSKVIYDVQLSNLSASNGTGLMNVVGTLPDAGLYTVHVYLNQQSNILNGTSAQWYINAQTASTTGTPLQITTTNLPSATVGQPYTAQLGATGGSAPYTWSYSHTSYPSACCVLGFGSDGVFTTQTSSSVLGPAGTYYWDVTVTDTQNTSVSQRVYLTINASPSTISNCQITSFYSETPTVVAGQLASLKWQTSGCTAVGLYATNASGTTFSSTLSSALSSSYLVTTNSPGTYYYRLSAAANSTVDPITTPINSTASFTVGSSSTPPPTSGTAYYGYPPKNVVSGGTVYLIDGHSKQPYTSAAAFLSYSFNAWANVTQASSTDLALPTVTYTPNGSTTTKTLFVQPRNGSLINDHGTVYIITNGLRAGFASEAIFKGLGFSFSNVIDGDTSFLVTLAPLNSSNQVHPAGTVINQDGTIYYIAANGSKMGIPDMAIFNSWGFKLQEVVPANFYDRQLGATSNLQFRATNQFTIN